jgi:hypothetical protein
LAALFWGAAVVGCAQNNEPSVDDSGTDTSSADGEDEESGYDDGDWGEGCDENPDCDDDGADQCDSDSDCESYEQCVSGECEPRPQTECTPEIQEPVCGDAVLAPIEECEDDVDCVDCKKQDLLPLTGPIRMSHHLALDAAGDFYVGSAHDGFLYVEKYTPDGTLLWTNEDEYATQARLTGLAVAPAGRVAAVGDTNLPDGQWGRLIDVDGTTAWSVPGIAGELTATAFRSDGAVMIAGRDGIEGRRVVSAHVGSEPMWSSEVSGVREIGTVVEGEGLSVYVLGNQPGGAMETLLAKYAADGSLEWGELEATGALYDAVWDDAAGELVAVGASSGGALVIAYSPEGEVQWEWSCVGAVYGYFGRVELMSDDRLLVSGGWQPGGAGNGQPWLAILDANGDVTFSRGETMSDVGPYWYFGGSYDGVAYYSYRDGLIENWLTGFVLP